MRRSLLPFAALALCLAAATAPVGCFSPRQPPCAFSCARDRLCPSGYLCGDDGLCHRADGQGVCALTPPDGGGADGAGASDGGDSADRSAGRDVAAETLPDADAGGSP